MENIIIPILLALLITIVLCTNAIISKLNELVNTNNKPKPSLGVYAIYSTMGEYYTNETKRQKEDGFDWPVWTKNPNKAKHFSTQEEAYNFFKKTWTNNPETVYPVKL